MLAGSSLIRKIHSTHVAAHILLKDVGVNKLILLRVLEMMAVFLQKFLLCLRESLLWEVT